MAPWTVVQETEVAVNVGLVYWSEKGTNIFGNGGAP